MLKRALGAVALVLTACGGGGGGDGEAGSSSPLTIITTQLQSGNEGYAYFQLVEAAGGEEPYFWWVSTDGDPLPTGLSITPQGSITGVPSGAVVADVVLVVQDASSEFVTVQLRIEVRDIQFTPATVPSLDPGGSVDFDPGGGNPGYTFTLVTNSTGATVDQNGVYTAGGGEGVDVVRLTDADGFFDEIAINVGTDPFAGFLARFGATDVWWVDWSVIYDPDPLYGSDLDEALDTLGLRGDPAGAGSNEANQAARDLVIRKTLGYASTYYGNGEDGNPLVGGLALSLVGPDGPSQGTTPPPAGIWSPQSFRYNTICMRHGPEAGVVGTAWLDPDNNSIEHNCGQSSDGDTTLGVFVNRLTGPYLSIRRNGLASNPISADDLGRLQALLRGEAPSDARAEDISELVEGFCSALGAVLAHEIGHSLGLEHSNPSGGDGDIMNARLVIRSGLNYTFNATHWSQLMQSLPGPNR